MLNRLLYRRQFLLMNDTVDALSEWKCFPIQHYFLYAHPDLEINVKSDHEGSMVLIGSIFDYREPKKENADILNDLFSGAHSKAGLASYLKPYSGCYAIIFIKRTEACILHDARGLREVFYCKEPNRVVCGSQPSLIAEFSDPAIKPSSDPELLDFKNNYLIDSQWIGDGSSYDTIKHLLPNHCLDLNNRTVSRYWPTTSLQNSSLKDAADKCGTILKRTMEAIVSRNPVMMAVTAGNDSRILLSACKELLDKIHFFVIDDNLGENNPDIYIPKAIFNKLGTSFTVYNQFEQLDEEFRQAYLKNVDLAEKDRLSYIYNVFFKHNPGKTLILGVSEIGRIFFGKAPRKLTIHRMASKNGFTPNRYTMKQCEKIRDELVAVAKKCNINVMTLFYWEQRLGNWAAAKNSESLIAVEKIDPFNSHLFYETLLSVDEKNRSAKLKTCILFNEIIQVMWPELLKWPINPVTSLFGKLKLVIVKLGFLDFLKEAKYQLNNYKYKLSKK